MDGTSAHQATSSTGHPGIVESDSSTGPAGERPHRCYICHRTEKELERFRAAIGDRISRRLQPALESLETRVTEKEQLVHSLTAMRENPNLRVTPDGTRVVNGLSYFGNPPKDPSLSLLIRPGGYVDRLSSDDELYRPIGRREPLATFLEAAIQLEESNRAAIKEAVEEVRTAVSYNEPLLHVQTARISALEPSRAVGLRRDPVSGGPASRLANVPSARTDPPGLPERKFSERHARREVQDALKGIALPGEGLEIGVRVCVVCDALLRLSRRQDEATEIFDDDDEIRSYRGDDDYPAEDFHTE